MAGILPPLVRTQQPNGPVKLNGGHPAYEGLTVWLSTSPNKLIGARELVAVSETGYNSSPIGLEGIARKWNRSAAAGIDFGVNQIFNGQAVTVLVVAAPVSAAAMKSAFSQRLGSGSFPQVDFIFNGTGDGLSASAGTVELVTYDGSSRGVTAASQTDGNVHCWVASNSTSLGYIFKDGVAQTLSQDVRISSAIYGATQKLVIGRLGDDTSSTTYQHDDPLYLVAVWNRQLPKNLAASLSVNPWQIFAPIPRNVFADVAGGSGSQTLSPSLYSNSQSFYAPTLAPGAVTVTPSLLTNTQSFYAPTVSIAGGPQQLTANRLDNTQVFYAPTLAPGAVTVTPSLYNNSQTFYSLTLSSTKTLSAALFTNAPTFYASIVSLGSGPQVISPPLLVNAQSYFTQLVTPGQVSLFPALLTNSQSFYPATVSDGSTGLPDAATRYTVTSKPRRLATSASARTYQVIK